MATLAPTPPMKHVRLKGRARHATPFVYLSWHLFQFSPERDGWSGWRLVLDVPSRPRRKRVFQLRWQHDERRFAETYESETLREREPEAHAAVLRYFRIHSIGR